MNDKRAVVLLSGGLDSTTCMAVAESQGYDLYALSFRYGQRHSVEIDSAERAAQHYNAAEHRIISLDPKAFSQSSLTGAGEVPDYEERGEEIPSTYVPARNLIFLSYASGFAETTGAEAVFAGVNAVDYSGYPDCRPEFISKFQECVLLATSAGIQKRIPEIKTPLIDLTKGEIIKLGISLGVDYSITHSCYNPDPENRPCRKCDSCVLRKKGFDEAGVPDPLFE